jgi:hypothetical protein
MRDNQGSEWWIYKQIHESADSLMGLLEEMLSRNKKYQISMFLLVSKRDIYEIFSSKKAYKFHTEYGNANQNNSIFSINITKKDEDQIKPTISGNVLFVRTPKSEIYLAITDEPREFVQFVLSPFLKAYYPYISKAFLSANDLQQILQKLENVTGSEIIADRITAHKRISYVPMKNDKPNKREKRKENKSVVTWTREPYIQVFNEAAANDQWIDKVQFQLISDSKVQMDAYFSRHGFFKFRDSISPFYQTVLPFIIEIIEKKFKLYSNRSRIAEKPKPSPLVIDLDYDVFSDISQNRRFIEILKNMSYVSMSVYHANPYVHLSLVDYLDGSSFDIWVLSSNRITIVPQLRATEASVARLMNHIFERFREGTVREYEGYVKTT